MREHFSKAVVAEDAYLPYLDMIELPDPDDRHVVAAAFVGGAEMLVTYNLKHFPEEALLPFELEPLHPDAFLTDLLDAEIRASGQPRKVLAAIRALRDGLRRPLSVRQWLQNLEEKLGLTAFVQVLRNYEPYI